MNEEIIEELIAYVMEEADRCYADDFPIDKIEHWIRDFFSMQNTELYQDIRICRKSSETEKINIKEISKEERELLDNIVEYYYGTFPGIVLNNYEFCRSVDGEILWKFPDYGLKNVWYPLDRLPAGLDDLIREKMLCREFCIREIDR